MRAVIIGSDFMYNSDNNLVPIEINTGIGWHIGSIIDSQAELDLTDLTQFVTDNEFTKIVYIGNVIKMINGIQSVATNLNLGFEHVSVGVNAITIPSVEDSDTTLIIRSAYDTTAIVDDMYCRDKVNFLDLIKEQSFGSQFAYIGDDSTVVNNISSIKDNGEHPNFILKSRTPNYDKNVYPKLYKVQTQAELDVVLANLDATNFLMEFHFNPTQLYENHIKLYRGLNLLFPPDLESISLGGYEYIAEDDLTEFPSIYDATTFELDPVYKTKYVSVDNTLTGPKLLDTDEVQMADGSFKTAVDLQIGDELKTIDIYNPNNINLQQTVSNFNISYEEFLSGSTFTTNTVTNKRRVSKIVNYVKMEFTDGTDWEDIDNSSYLSIQDGNVKFLRLFSTDNTDPELENFRVKIGDTIILVDTTNGELNTVTKEVANITTTRKIITGWQISVAENHMFLTRNNGNISYAAIEHNFTTCYSSSFTCEQSAYCYKGQYCIRTFASYPCWNAPSCICSTQCYQTV